MMATRAPSGFEDTRSRFDAQREKLTTYFDSTARKAWIDLTSDAKVSGIRATVRAGRDAMRDVLLGWLEMRQADSMDPPTNDAAYRSTATSVKGLPKTQLAITYWLSRRYRVSPEPIAALVTQAWDVGERSQISPTLLLAIMAIESKFNPFTAGTQGAMGLMQIDPDARATELSPFGGRLAVFDPVTNLRVGARHLQDLMLQSESIEEALRLYAVASGQSDVGPYVERVLNEQKMLDKML